MPPLSVWDTVGREGIPFVISMMDRAEQGKSRSEKCERSASRRGGSFGICNLTTERYTRSVWRAQLSAEKAAANPRKH